MLIFTCRWMCLGYLAFLSTAGFTAQPLMSMLPITPIPTTIPNNGTTITVIYNVSNNTQNTSLTQFAMSNIPGVEQITDTTGACNTDSPTSCLLYLVFHGDQTMNLINDGPIIGTGSNLTRPSSGQTLHTTTEPASTQVNNTWISALIEQDPAPSASGTPPNDLAT